MEFTIGSYSDFLDWIESEAHPEELVEVPPLLYTNEGESESRLTLGHKEYKDVLSLDENKFTDFWSAREFRLRDVDYNKYGNDTVPCAKIDVNSRSIEASNEMEEYINEIDDGGADSQGLRGELKLQKLNPVTPGLFPCMEVRNKEKFKTFDIISQTPSHIKY